MVYSDWTPISILVPANTFWLIYCPWLRLLHPHQCFICHNRIHNVPATLSVDVGKMAMRSLSQIISQTASLLVFLILLISMHTISFISYLICLPPFVVWCRQFLVSVAKVHACIPTPNTPAGRHDWWPSISAGPHTHAGGQDS